MLLPLLGKPLLGYMTDILSFYGMNEIVLLLDAQSEKVSEYLKNNPTCGAKVKPVIALYMLIQNTMIKHMMNV